MLGPTRDARIYLLDGDERQVTPGGPAIIGPDGKREEVPPMVYRALEHVLKAMRAGQAVKVTPFRPELPIDEAAYAIGVRSDVLRKHVAAGEIPFRSTEYVDWVRLADVIRWDNARHERQRAALDEMLADEPEDEA
ncbi:hypothetical protein [Kribbella sp. NPDC048915]|uniref:hypothetical protein n=1 Tax=Kribbella sp. NPDC048915 TaxID=3155148 RepID=UPI003409EA82